MSDSTELRLPGPEAPEPGRKRRRAAAPEAGEAERRSSNTRSLEALSGQDGAVRLLEELLFGAEEELLGRLEEEEEEEEEKEQHPGSSLVEEQEEESRASEEEEEEEQEEVRTAVWVDEDDELDQEVDMKHRYRGDLVKGHTETRMKKHKLQERMREQFQRSMGGAPSWASSSRRKRRADEEEEEEEEEELLRRTGNMVAASDRLPSGVLRMKKCPHANAARPSRDRLTSVQFHPNAAVVMTAGIDQSVALFQVDGKSNPKIQSVHLDGFPVHKARFTRDGLQLVATGLKNKMFYLYDMMEGRVSPVHSVRGLNESRVKEFSVTPEGNSLLLTGTNGYLHLLTLKTKEVVLSLKADGEVVGVCFSPDGQNVFTSTAEGQVFVWDVRSSRCVSRFQDEGCVTSSSIASSPDGHFLACGSQSGVVNVYSQGACLSSANPRPLRAVKNLTTSATTLEFNPTSEILALGSQEEEEQARLVHLSSLSVFSNFPVCQKKFVFRPSCFSFSPHSGFFSLANNKGHAPLFRLLHYKDF